MFSATKLVGLAAALALVGGLMLAVPLHVDEEAIPGVGATDPSDYVTLVSGTMTVLSLDEDGDRDYDAFGPDGLAVMGQNWTTEFDIDDPRLDGRGRSRHNVYQRLGGRAMRALTSYQENDDGSWVGTGYGYHDPETTGIHYRQVLHGQGGYEGLHVILDLDQPAFSGEFEVSGVIVSGDLPPMPDPAPSTFE